MVAVGLDVATVCPSTLVTATETLIAAPICVDVNKNVLVFAPLIFIPLDSH